MTRFRNGAVALLLLGLPFLGADRVEAKPKHTRLQDVFKTSPTIVVAKILDRLPDQKTYTAQVEVLQVLKGKLRPGKHRVPFEDLPYLVADDSEQVIFLDEKGVWRFTASPTNGRKKVGEGLLHLGGCHEKEGHYVSPGVLTLEQLQAYLKGKALVYRFRGEVFFPRRGKVAWAASPFSLTGSYEVGRKEGKVRGLPDRQGFLAQPEVTLFSWGESDIHLKFTRPSARPLTLHGKVHGVDPKTGELLVRFAVTSPQLLTEKAFKEYLADPKKGDCYTTFNLVCAPTKEHPRGRVLKLTLGKWTADQWDSIQVDGWGARTLQPFSTSYATRSIQSGSLALGRFPGADALPRTVLEEGGCADGVFRMTIKVAAREFLTFAFDLGEPAKGEDAFSWAVQNRLLYALYSKAVEGWVVRHDGKTARTVARFKVAFDSMGFNSLERD
jgi:hypothetical protein